MEGNSQATSIDRVMERQVITVSPDDSLDELINLEVGRLPVIDNGRLVGMVTRSDLAKAYYSSARELERSLDIIIESVHNAMITIDESGQVQILIQLRKSCLTSRKRRSLVSLSPVYAGRYSADILKSGKTNLAKRLSSRIGRFCPIVPQSS